jgi:hypothetical protein
MLLSALIDADHRKQDPCSCGFHFKRASRGFLAFLPRIFYAVARDCLVDALPDV